MGDVGNYRMIQARHYTPGRNKAIRLIVVHDMESGESSTTAENVAAWFAGPTAPQASAHFCVDSDSIVRCVHDGDTAWHAPNANADGIGIEHAGRAAQTAAQWLDPYGKAMLERSAVLTAQLCHAYGIPPVHLSTAQVADGRTKGICGHLDVTNAFHNPGGHTDPGPNFPWTYYLGRVRAHMTATVPSWYHRQVLVTSPAMTGTDVIEIQHLTGAKVSGKYDALTRDRHVIPWQKAHGILANGIFGLQSAQAAYRLGSR